MANGKSVTIRSAPQRIVSGSILTDGVLLEICPLERVRALHRISKDPLFSPVAKLSAAFPTHLNGEAEPMLAQDPDLVFVASFSLPETRARLADAGVVVLRIDDFDNFADIASNLREIGYALGLDTEAEGLVTTMNATLADLARDRARRSGWRLLLWSDGYTAGRDTLFQAMLDSTDGTLPLSSPWKDDFDRGQQLIADYAKQSDLDFVNFHWYVDDAKALKQTVKYLRSATGHEVISHETGQHNTDPVVVTSRLKTFDQLHVPWVIWFDADGIAAFGLHDVDTPGTLRPNGTAFATSKH